MRALVLIVVAIALAACGRSSAYPPEYELNFMRACEARSVVPGLCACTWDKIEEGITVSEFTALETTPASRRESHPTKLRIDQFALACARELSADAPAKD